MRSAAFIALVLFSNGADASSRDWTVERPWLAGFLNGVSFGSCTTCRLGAGVREVSVHDPYVVPEVVRLQMINMGQTSHSVGLFMGGVLSLLALLALGRRALVILLEL